MSKAPSTCSCPKSMCFPRISPLQIAYHLTRYLHLSEYSWNQSLFHRLLILLQSHQGLQISGLRLHYPVTTCMPGSLNCFPYYLLSLQRLELEAVLHKLKDFEKMIHFPLLEFPRVLFTRKSKYFHKFLFVN